MDHVAGLRAVLGENASLITDSEITLSYSKDQAPFAPHEAAAIVLLAKSTEEVAKAVAYANAHNIPVVPRLTFPAHNRCLLGDHAPRRVEDNQNCRRPTQRLILNQKARPPLTVERLTFANS